MAGAALGDELRLPVARDTWVSSAKGEEEGNNGGERRLKAKSYQEMTLLDLDVAPLRGRVIERATLHFRSVSGPPLRRATVSSVASPWTEGTSRNYAREVGAASFRYAETGRRAWTDRGGDLSDVVLSAGNTLWAFADATPPDEDGWQSLSVDPRVLATRVAGVGFGFLLFDDVGSEYTRDGDKFAYHPFPNRFIASREAGAESAPYWTVVLGAHDTTPPPPVAELTAAFENGDEGFTLAWRTSADFGTDAGQPSGTLGFLVRFTTEAEFDWNTAREVPQYLVPTAHSKTPLVRARLPGLRVEPGSNVQFAVCAADAAGNRSTEERVSVRCLKELPVSGLPRRKETAAPERVPGLRLGATQIAILDELEKIELSSQSLPPSIDALRAPDRLLLYGGDGEWLGFQVALLGPTAGLKASVSFDERLCRGNLYVARGVTTPLGRFADPLEPWDGQSAIDLGPDNVGLLFVDLHVRCPNTEFSEPRSGVQSGTLTLELGAERVELQLRIGITPARQPERLSFVPEMNAYDLPPPPYELDWYRLAHEHRTNLNVLRYDWKGRVHAGCAPTIVDGKFEWQEFDERFGPLLDGSAFKNSARGAVPVDHFYLPLHENWPVAIEPHWRGGYWADTALDAAYWSEFEACVQQFVQHLNRFSGHPGTTFEFYLNNKLYHKGTDWGGSSAPWVFDEPMHTQDFFALSLFARAFHNAIVKARAANVVFRLDDSRPQWRRDFLDGLVGVHVVGSAFDTYRERVLEKQREFGERVMLYATANAVEKSNVMPVAWCIDAWLKGADGVIPWQTIGRAESWNTGDPLALLYPPKNGQPGPPVPSLRLKAFRRGQQDVEYLIQYQARHRWNRAEVARQVRARLDLRSNSRARFEDDAGELEYPFATPRALAELRLALLQDACEPR